MKVTILVDPSLVIITIHLICPGVEKKIFKKYINFTLFTTKLPPLGVGGHEIYNFLSPYPTKSIYQVWLRLAHAVVLGKKMLMNDFTMTDANP